MDLFLRSINIELDAVDPTRIAHFRPTNKSIGLLKLLTSDDSNAIMIAAPYGVGKSITATVALHLIENQKINKQDMKSVADRIKAMNPKAGRDIDARRRLKNQGLVLALQGHAESVPDAVKRAVVSGLKRIGCTKLSNTVKRHTAETMDDIRSLFEWLIVSTSEKEIDRVLIVWDEFGRHLEYLVSTGRSTELLDVQQLAEYVSRQTALPMNFAIMLHQGLLSYSTNLPDSAKREWNKIEGRFESFSFYDDSFELIRIASDLVASMQPANFKKLTAKDAEQTAKKIKSTKPPLFADTSISQLKQVARDSSAVSLPALWVLPRVATRIAQNERTLFTFINSMAFEKKVVISDLYNYFGNAMRLDTGPGGTYRRYIESESAIAKCQTALEQQVISTCAILSLAFARSENSLSKKLLEAILQIENGSNKANAAVKFLIDRKLLLHRRHNDDVSVWHGTDVDLRSKQEAIKDSNRPGFDLCEFLERECSPPIWRPIEFNNEFQMRRFYTSHFIQANELALDSEIFSVPPGEDGRIFYVIPSNNQDLKEVKLKIKKSKNQQCIFAVPNKVVAIHEAALEVYAIMCLQADRELTSSDPLILEELQIMEDDARSYLNELVNLIVEPNSECEWFHRTKKQSFEDRRKFRRWLSERTAEIFPLTPCINNEIVNRNKPSSPVVNARKKLIEGVLESNGEESFNLEDRPDIGAAVVGLARGLCERTGLYIKKGRRWEFAKSRSIEDEGLQSAWACIEDFMIKKGKEPKSFEVLLDELQSPPYGIRAGMLPILIACGFKAFPVSTVLLCDDRYVDDLTPTVIETLCKEPERFSLRVIKLTKAQEAYLSLVFEMFAEGSTYEIEKNDLLRACAEAIASWQDRLSNASRRSYSLSKETMQIRSLLKMQHDPSLVFLNTIPKTFSSDVDYKSTIKKLQKCKNEIEHGVLSNYFARAIESTRQAMVYAGKAKNESVRTLAKSWANSITGGVARTIESKNAIAAISASKREYESDELFINGLAVSVYGKPVSHWADEDVHGYAEEIRKAVRDLEDGVLSYVSEGKHQKENSEIVTRFLQSRAGHLIELLRKHGGQSAVDDLTDSSKKRNAK